MEKHYLKKTVLFWSIVIGIIGSDSLDAQNLVPNADFEEMLICPDYNSQLDRCASWSSPSSATPDYFHECCWVTNSQIPGDNVSTPINYGGFQEPRSGVAYAGIITYVADDLNGQEYIWREYLMTELQCPLVQGVTYNVGFYVNKAENLQFATDRIGAFLSVGPVDLGFQFGTIPVTPQIENVVGNILTDIENWVLVSGNYTALGGETHIIIGSFSDNNETQLSDEGFVPPAFFGYEHSYYYIEDVYVIPQEVGAMETVTLDTTMCSGSNLLLDFTTPNSTYNWNNGSVEPILTVTEPGIYWVEITTPCLTVKKIINVTEVAPTPVNLGTDQQLCIGETLILNAPSNAWDYLWQDGSVLATYTVNTTGTYWLQAETACGVSADTIQVTVENCNVIIPNVFTPDNDGINDQFFIETTSFVGEIQSLEILNRWGELVSTITLPMMNPSWDGKVGGKECSEGVYFLKLIYKDLDGTMESMHGFVQLIR